ncbi:RNA polymerase sigma-70 factor (ECF subfamily) [Aquimarina sp. EL_43]|uniref:RNA polymerase sigma factor n=1 Tax=Aquimarina atlantica TaxID=1317122 RepID=A0A023BPP8_9FLAO|nr:MULTISPECIES: RNA polymerase sigma factor [Aquimarina]EZH72030.1 RNA polymerase subunit sigma-24 [Aquimarina atlantica]MBG6132056.1 RNA polymerase sigma-70 factor (ECF subfamily) [Aquimarina sp. EL_35]MBG6152853.1 RNA polymerase sigma-70 factor (ECF subfamily) [Aquimarina sp. EL_32]MBG6170860.1 RNA polymerase sigma-70 factor (ECF subfamily) [Aquimarina sp. EL_43]
METNILYTHKDLVEKSKSGDRNSQYRLYELYVDAMYNVSMRMLSIKEDAEDVVQDSFVEAFKNLKSFRYESTFGSWLKRIVINKSLNHLKLKKIPVTPLDQHEYHISEEIIDPVKPKDINKIKKGIKILPDGYRQILSLYLIEGYDHIEIAEILGITISTSKSQYHRAKKKLIEIVNTL